MRPQLEIRLCSRKVFLLVICLCSLGILLSKTNSKNSIFANNLSELNIDTLLPDTSTIFEDTVVYIDGLDSIYVLNEDTTGSSIDSSSDSIELRAINAVKDMGIRLGGTELDVESGLFGVHIEGMFYDSHMPEFDPVNYPGYLGLA